MNGATHIDMTKVLAEAIGWKGDVNLLARNASFPDDARVITIEGYGAHLFGKNIASFTHFCRPVLGTEGVRFEGYGYKIDRSVPHFDLSNRKVVPAPKEWGFPIAQDESLLLDEPLAKLIATLTDPATKGCIEADELTYPTAANMAAWASKAAEKLRGGGQLSQKAIDTLAGWIMHFVEDCCVPHHAEGLCLKGHQGYEGDLEERWREMRGNGEAQKLVDRVKPDSEKVQRMPRSICEGNALGSQCSPGMLGWYRWFWRRGWHRLIDQSIGRACRTGIEALRQLA